MTNAFPGHSAPAAGFEVPLEMLAACHQRVQSQCATLLRLVPHMAAHGADRQAQEAATAVMRGARLIGTNDDPTDEIMVWLYRSGGAAPHRGHVRHGQHCRCDHATFEHPASGAQRTP